MAVCSRVVAYIWLRHTRYDQNEQQCLWLQYRHMYEIEFRNAKVVMHTVEIKLYVVATVWS